MAADPLLTIAEELYGLVLGEFTGTRNQWAKQTKADGDAQLAGQVAGLRKPALSAWVVNQMMRHQGEQMTQVLALGASLRQAQAELDADALRELTKQRRQLTTAVTRQGRVLAGELGQKVTDAVADQVQETLHAAMVDEAAASAVRSGMLVTPLAATGVDAADVADAVAVPAAIGMTPRARPRPAARRAGLSVVPDGHEPARKASARVDKAAAEAEARAAAEAEARAAAEAALEQAVAEADDAKRRLGKARRRVSKVEARTLQTADELEQARGRVAQLEHDLEQLDEEAVQAERKRERAEERYAAAQDALDRARAVVTDFG